VQAHCTFQEEIHSLLISVRVCSSSARQLDNHQSTFALDRPLSIHQTLALVFPWFSKVTNLTPAHPSSACWGATLFRCYRVTEVAAQFDTLFNVHFLPFTLAASSHWCGRRDAARCELYETAPAYVQTTKTHLTETRCLGRTQFRNVFWMVRWIGAEQNRLSTCFIWAVCADFTECELLASTPMTDDPWPCCAA
jgi:hypothetical protein